MTALPVLVVEDSFLIAASLEDSLQQAGLRVLLAGSVAEAEAHLIETGFTAALLDFVLPDGDSLDLARRLHAGGCKVALVSGADRDVVPADPAIAAHFSKPYEDQALVDWVKSVSKAAAGIAYPGAALPGALDRTS